MDRVEARHSSSSLSLTPGKDCVHPPGPQCHAGEAATDNADVLSLFAPKSLFDSVHHSEGASHWEDPHLENAEVNEESVVVGEFSTLLLTEFLVLQKLLFCSPLCLTQSMWEVSGRAYLRLIPHLVFQWQMIMLQC